VRNVLRAEAEGSQGEELSETEEKESNTPPDWPAPDYPSIHSHFVFPEIRPAQKEILSDIAEAFSDSGIRNILIEAPTGIGKSGIALTAACAAGSAHIATANKDLQDQYSREFKHLAAEVKGRANYSCVRHTGFDCSNSPCRHDKASRSLCKKYWACGFHKALDRAMKTPNTLFNFASFLAFMNRTPYFGVRELGVFDEAHNIPDWLTNFVELSVSESSLEKLGLEPYVPEGKEIDDFTTWLDSLLNQGKTRKRLVIDLSEKDKLESLIDKIETVLDDVDNFAVIIEQFGIRGRAMRTVRFKPIEVSKYSHFLFGKTERNIFLSATLLDTRTYMSLLGMDPKETMIIRVPSEFAPENRPIIMRFAGKASWKNMDTYVPAAAEQIRKILAEHPDEKGIIHGNSYKLCAQLYDLIGSSRILFPKNSKAKADVMKQHAESDAPSVLLSPSMTEGIDLKDDLSRFQIIAKVPYPALKDPIVKKRMQLYPTYYEMQTALTITQAYGRSVRNTEDHARTYVTDTNFKFFTFKAWNILPEFFKQGIKAGEKL